MRSTRVYLLMSGMRPRLRKKKLRIGGKNCWRLKGRRELKRD